MSCSPLSRKRLFRHAGCFFELMRLPARTMGFRSGAGEKRSSAMRRLLPWMAEAAPMRLVGEELDNLMMMLFGDRECRVARPMEEKWTPRVDVEETEKELLVKVDLPGIEPKD